MRIACALSLDLPHFFPLLSLSLDFHKAYLDDFYIPYKLFCLFLFDCDHISRPPLLCFSNSTPLHIYYVYCACFLAPPLARTSSPGRRCFMTGCSRPRPQREPRGGHEARVLHRRHVHPPHRHLPPPGPHDPPGSSLRRSGSVHARVYSFFKDALHPGAQKEVSVPCECLFCKNPIFSSTRIF